MTNILVLDANQRSALATTRSLSKQTDLCVFTSDDTPNSLSGQSRYSHRYFQYPSPATDSHAFLDCIVKIIKNNDIDYIQPMTEVSSRILSQQRTLLGNCVLPFASHEKILQVSDKSRLMLAASALEVPIPTTRYFNQLSEWEYLLESTFPLIVKPSLSRICTHGRWISTTVRKVNNAQELTRIIERDRYLSDNSFMVQAFIDGHGAGVFAIYKEGQPICHFSHQRLREKPPSGGVSVLCQSMPVDPLLQKYSDLILGDCQWSGVAMVEYRIARDGKPYLMEINTRFWGSLQLSIDSGVDFPYLLFRSMCDQKTTTAQSYSVHNKLRWYLGDADNLLLFCRDRNNSFIAKLKHLLQFLRH